MVLLRISRREVVCRWASSRVCSWYQTIAATRWLATNSVCAVSPDVAPCGQPLCIGIPGTPPGRFRAVAGPPTPPGLWSFSVCETEGGGGPGWLSSPESVPARPADRPGAAWHIDTVFRLGGAGPLRQRAGYADGLRSIAIGLAASRSIAAGQAVNVSELGFPLEISGALCSCMRWLAPRG